MNQGPKDYESSALTAELMAQVIYNYRLIGRLGQGKEMLYIELICYEKSILLNFRDSCLTYKKIISRVVNKKGGYVCEEKIEKLQTLVKFWML